MVRPRGRMLELRGYHFPGCDCRLVAAATRLHVLLQLLQCFINALTMRDSDSLVIANQCRQRNRFRRTGQALAILVDLLFRSCGSNQLLAGVWVLACDKTLVLLALNVSLKVPFFCEATTPSSVHFAALAVIVLSRACVFLLVIVLRLPGGKCFAHSHHRLNPGSISL